MNSHLAIWFLFVCGLHPKKHATAKFTVEIQYFEKGNGFIFFHLHSRTNAIEIMKTLQIYRSNIWNIFILLHYFTVKKFTSEITSAQYCKPTVFAQFSNEERVTLFQ